MTSTYTARTKRLLGYIIYRGRKSVLMTSTERKLPKPLEYTVEKTTKRTKQPLKDNKIYESEKGSL